MVAGLIVFVLGKKVLLGAGEAPAPLTRQKEMATYGIGLAAVAVMWALVQYQDVIQTLLIVSGLALLGYVLYESFKLPKEPRERMFAILFLIALNPLFWGLFEQAGGSFNLYHRPLCRPVGGRAGLAVPVDQPDLHHPLRAALRRAVAMARASAGSSRRRPPSSRWRWRRSGLASSSSSGAPTASGPRSRRRCSSSSCSTCSTRPASFACRRSGLSAMNRLAP